MQIAELIRRLGVYVVLVLLIIAGSSQYASFLSGQNIGNIATQAAPIVLTSLGQTFVLLTGEIDLSVGSIVSIVSVIVANGMAGRDSLVLPVLVLALLAGALTGLVNGVLTTFFRIPSFIVTLATLLILQGINLVWTAGAPSSTLAPSFDGFTSQPILAIPFGAYVVVAALLLAHFVLKKTYAGRLFFLIGSNPRAVHIAGLPVASIKTLAFVLSGLLAACAGIFLTSYVGSGQSWLGAGMELTAIAATVIGGTDLFGGRGTAAGAVGGGLLLTVIFNLLIFMGVASAYDPVATGAILLAGIGIYLASENPRNWRRTMHHALVTVEHWLLRKHL
ncbi:MAG: ABC transporter permease [Acetobacteraceae bacterium]